MLVYLIIATVAIGAVAGAQHVECSDCALPAVLSRHQAAHALWVIAFFVLFVPAALRYDIGVDYSAAMEENGYLGYKQLFEMYAHAPVPADGDVGFYALIKLVGLFSDNAQWLFVLLSALVYGLTLRALRRLSAAPVLSVALFLAAGFYFESYSIQKQWVAIACALNALEWVGGGESGEGRRSFARYAAWIVAGSLIHSSCLVWLFAWPLLCMRLTVRRAALALAALVAAAFVGKGVLVAFASWTRFGVYLDPVSPVYVGPHPRPHYIVAIALTWLFCLWALTRASRGKAQRDDGVEIYYGRWASALLMCLTIDLALLVCGIFLPLIVSRLSAYFMPVIMLLMPHCLASVQEVQLRRLLTAGIVGSWVVVTLLVVVVAGRYSVVPYKSVFGPHAASDTLEALS